MSSETGDISDDGNILSPREEEVLRWVARAMSNKEVARELKISVATVDRHVVNMLEKTGCKNRTEIALYALRNGLISSEDMKA